MTTRDPALQALDGLIGQWTTEATHPAFPGLVVHGTVDAEWLEGEQYLIHRAHVDHPDFPDSISIIGNVDLDRVESTDTDLVVTTDPSLSMHYFDSRGVFREYRVTSDGVTWRIWRDSPGFSQRFAATIDDAGNTIPGQWEVSEDDLEWVDDLQITYHRT